VTAPLLETRGLAVSFGGLRAVDRVDLAVPAGGIVGLIGPNGAGKTTFIDALTGFVPSRGSIRFAGTELAGSTPDRRARAGLGRTWQSLELFDDLTVDDNLRVAAERQSAGRFLADLVRPARRRSRADVDFALDVLGLGDLADRMPTEISQGQRKLVSAARALAARPQLVCMDEPAAGLDTAESSAFGDQLRRIRDAGITVLLVDHDMGLVLDVCDLVYVIEFGRRIAVGPPAEIVRDAVVIEAYLGAAGTEGEGGGTDDDGDGRRSDA
jgi:branched-chain amino acid transport system ATP-binding protein